MSRIKLPQYLPNSWRLEGYQLSYKPGDWVDTYFTGPIYAGTGKVIACHNSVNVDFMYVTPRFKTWTDLRNINWGTSSNVLPSLIPHQLCLK